MDAHCAFDMPRTWARRFWGDVWLASLEMRLKSWAGLRREFKAGWMYACIVWTELGRVSTSSAMMLAPYQASCESGLRWCHAALVGDELAELEADF